MKNKTIWGGKYKKMYAKPTPRKAHMIKIDLVIMPPLLKTILAPSNHTMSRSGLQCPQTLITI